MTTYASLLLGQAPLLLTYIGAVIVCAILWRRAPVGALLAIFGIGLMLLATLLSVGSNIWMVQRRNSGGAVASLAQVMMIVGLVGTVLRAGGLALLVAGVFAGRQREEVTGFDIHPTGYPPPR